MQPEHCSFRKPIPWDPRLPGAPKCVDLYPLGFIIGFTIAFIIAPCAIKGVFANFRAP